MIRGREKKKTERGRKNDGERDGRDRMKRKRKNEEEEKGMKRKRTFGADELSMCSESSCVLCVYTRGSFK